MSSLVVVLLAVLWLGIFLPSLLQARRTSSPYASASTFQESLRRLSASQTAVGEALQHSGVAAGRPAPRSAAATARRREVLAVLAAAVAAGVILAVGFGGPAAWAPLPPAVALAGYLVVLRLQVLRRQAARFDAGVVMQPGPAASPDVGDVAPAPAAPDSPSEDVVIVPSVRRRSDPLAGVDRIAG